MQSSASDSMEDSINSNEEVVIDTFFLSKEEVPDDIFETLVSSGLIPHLVSCMVDPSPNSNNLRVFDRKVLESGAEMALIHYIIHPPVGRESIRGVVVGRESPKDSADANGWKIVCRSFPFTRECFSTDLCVPSSMLKNTSIIKAYEGTILRLFWFGGEWHLSTHRKINGRNSSWSGPKTFGEMFDEIWDDDSLFKIETEREDSDTVSSGKLNKDIVYIFLLCHPLNRLVCVYSSPKLYIVGTYNQKTGVLNYDSKDVSEISGRGVHIPETVNDIQKWGELISFVNNQDWEKETGVLLISRGANSSINDSASVIKILNPTYSEKRDLRGNEPNLRIRWFQLLEENHEKELEELLPEKSVFFEQLRLDCENALNYLLASYEHRYVQHNYLELPKEEHIVLEALVRDLILPENKEKDLKEVLRSTISRYNPRIRNAVVRNMIKYTERCEKEDSEEKN